MKKACTILALVLCIFLLCGPALAESWVCSVCGSENTTNFCGNCGAKKPSGEWTCPDCRHVNTTNFCANCGKPRPTDNQASTISDISIRDTEDGRVTITWKDSADHGPYEIFYTTDDWQDYQTKYGVTNYSSKSASVMYLIPGVRYHITVTNGLSSATVDYTPTKRTYSEFKGGKRLEVEPDSFNVSGDGYYQTFRYTVYYPRLSRSRTYNALMVLRTPKGYCSGVITHEPFEMDKQYIGMYSDADLSIYLDAIKANFGDIPRGEYTLEMYFDGCLYASATMYIYP